MARIDDWKMLQKRSGRTPSSRSLRSSFAWSSRGWSVVNQTGTNWAPRPASKPTSYSFPWQVLFSDRCQICFLTLEEPHVFFRKMEYPRISPDIFGSGTRRPSNLCVARVLLRWESLRSSSTFRLVLGLGHSGTDSIFSYFSALTLVSQSWLLI